MEAEYKRTGQLAPDSLRRKSYLLFWLATLLLATLVSVAAGSAWFYWSFMRETAVTLGPGIHAILGGGGNSLVVEDGADVLLINTKFPPGSEWLHAWVGHNVKRPVTKIVNTHYHYDHTEGNSLYPEADKIAEAEVPTLMRRFDSDWWSTHPAGIPMTLVPASGMELAVGSQKVILRNPSPAHTSGDLWVYLPAENIVATGDLVFNRYYPFMDQPEGGTSIPGIITAVRQLARDYSTARFVPGHGPLATASDLQNYANYLESLSSSVRRVQQQHKDERAAANEIDLSQWQLSILPSFHHKQMIWSTAANKVRWAFRLEHSEGVDKL